MKFLLFNVNDTNKNRVNQISIDSNNYINEVSLSKSMLEKLSTEPNGFIQKIKYKLWDKNIEKQIFKALDGWNTKWYYAFSNNILNKELNNKYLFNKLESLLGSKFVVTYELDSNIFKYIDEYLENNTLVKKHETKVLIVANNNKSLNFTLLNNLINEYKVVNIYLNEKPSVYTLKKIKQINKEQGTTIDVVKNERKSFVEYNVIYFIDDIKENFPRLRFNKNSLVIDNKLGSIDKFNSNIMYINEYMDNNDVFSSNIHNLMNIYGNLMIASIVTKIVNVLDKT